MFLSLSFSTFVCASLPFSVIHLLSGPEPESGAEFDSQLGLRTLHIGYLFLPVSCHFTFLVYSLLNSTGADDYIGCIFRLSRPAFRINAKQQCTCQPPFTFYPFISRRLTLLNLVCALFSPSELVGTLSPRIVLIIAGIYQNRKIHL